MHNLKPASAQLLNATEVCTTRQYRAKHRRRLTGVISNHKINVVVDCATCICVSQLICRLVPGHNRINTVHAKLRLIICLRTRQRFAPAGARINAFHVSI